MYSAAGVLNLGGFVFDFELRVQGLILSLLKIGSDMMDTIYPFLNTLLASLGCFECKYTLRKFPTQRPLFDRLAGPFLLIKSFKIM